MVAFRRRMAFSALLLSLLSTCERLSPDQIGWVSSTFYNCLNLGNQTLVQLNTHLEPVPEIAVSTSPDGNYQIVSSARTLGSRFLYLRDVNTRKQYLLDDAVREVERVLWAPNSQFVNYDWEDTHMSRYHGIAATQTREILIARERLVASHIEAFSYDGEYFAMSRFNPSESSLTITVHPTRPSSYHSIVAELESAERFAWSPVDHRLAYATNSGLGILDLDIGVTHQQPHFDGHTFTPSHNLRSPAWSPDGRYLIIRYGFWPYDDKVGVYSTENRSFAMLTQFDSAALPNACNAFRESFDPDGRTIVYAVKPNSEEPYFDLWRFDLNTSRHELLGDHLTSLCLSGERLVIARKTPHEWLLEIRDRSGSVLQSYSLSSAESSGTWSCQRLDAPVGDVIDCHERDNFVLLDESMTPIWRTDLRDDDGPKVLAFRTSDNKRFIARSFSQDERVWLEFIDLATRHTYRLPEQFNTVVALGETDLGSFDIYPAPDEQSWLVVVDRALFRLFPADNAWELIEAHSLMDHLVWSPDGRRYAFIRRSDPAVGVGDLYVRERNESRQWRLGMFPDAMLSGIAWTHCGDIAAPFRDHLAAQSLD